MSEDECLQEMTPQEVTVCKELKSSNEKHAVSMVLTFGFEILSVEIHNDYNICNVQITCQICGITFVGMVTPLYDARNPPPVILREL